MSARESFLVIGIVDVGPIVRSGKTAGYDIYAIDYFGDIDVRVNCKESLSILENTKRPLNKINISQELLYLAKELASRNHIDFILLASGLDDRNEILLSLSDIAPIKGNSPNTIRRVRDKQDFFSELQRINVHYPLTHTVSCIRDALNAANDIGFPLIIKPSAGFGGIDVVKVNDRTELERFFKRKSDGQWLIQEYLLGTPASVSFLGDGDSGRFLTLNEQILGMREFGLGGDFTYCGNIVPLKVDDYLIKVCEDVSHKIAGHFGLQGSNGIDLIFSGDGDIVSILEVNPRFQGSMDCVERYLGINLVREHVITCCGEKTIVKLPLKPFKYYMRAILFAKSLCIYPDLTAYDFIRDIPSPDRRIPEGDPICSVIASSDSRDQVIIKAKKHAEKIYELGVPS